MIVQVAEANQWIASAVLDMPRARLERDDSMLPGSLSLPHGYGQAYPDPDGTVRQTGPRVNDLTSADRCDPWAKTPYHKYVPVRVRAAG